MLNSDGVGVHLQSITDQVTKITTAAITSFFQHDLRAFLSDTIHAAVKQYSHVAEPRSSDLGGQVVPDIMHSTSSQDFDRSTSYQLPTGQDTTRTPLPDSSQQLSLLSDSYNGDYATPDACFDSPPHSQAGSLMGYSPPVTDHPFTFYSTLPRPFTPVINSNGKGKAREVIDITSPEVIPTSSGIETWYDNQGGRATTSRAQMEPEIFRSNGLKIPPSSPSPSVVGRKRSLSHLSEIEENQETPSSRKRPCQLPPTGQKSSPIIFYSPSPCNAVSLPTRMRITNQEVTSSNNTRQSSPLQPSHVTRIDMDSIRTAIQMLMRNPNAKEKSVAQMDALLAVVNAKTDLLITMATGGGKSMLWLVPSYLSKTSKSIVICPFVSLLQEQYQKAQAFNIQCHKFSQSTAVPSSTQLLFAQVENVGSRGFAAFLASPTGKQFNRIFVDECHDATTGHPQRASKWKALASQFSRRNMPVILLSATVPPHLVHRFAEAFKMKKDELIEIRSSTDRPEIGMHVVRIPVQATHSDAFKALIRLTDKLSARLKEGGRMLVFFNTNDEAESYANKTGSAVYHSKLYEQGNTRAENLLRWDEGHTQIMACTTAFAQGVDRPNVRFVVIFKPSFGLLAVNQMLGRAGRDGKPSHVFFLTVGKVILSSNAEDAMNRCVKELEVVVNSNCCRRHSNTKFMDGEDLGMTCVEGCGIQCDICDPQSEMQRLAMKAIEIPTPTPNTTSDVMQAPPAIPQPARRTFVPASSLLRTPNTTSDVTRPPPAIPISTRPTLVPASSLLNAAPDTHHTIAHAMTLMQGSDDLYGSAEITPSQEEALHVIESNHHARRAMPSKATIPLQPQHPKAIRTAAYKSSSQPSKNATSWASVAPPASLPSNSRSVISRAARHEDITKERLRRTALLDRYMQVLEGRCPLHFGWEGTRVLQEQHACYLEPQIGFSKYWPFKRSFRFERFTYCYKCALPQDNNGNPEQPQCHAGVGFGKDSICPFDGFIFKTVYCIWNRGIYREHLKHELGAPDSWEDFVAWVGEEPGNGQYNNLLEVFLWFCNRQAARSNVNLP